MDAAASPRPDAPVAAAVAAALAGAHSPAPPAADLALWRVATAGAPETETRFAWVGSPWRLLGPCLFNGLMTVLTLGVYGFWGRTEIRRRMWASVRLDGEPLVYITAQGKELFKGFMAALIVVLLPLFIIGTVLVITYGQGSPGWAAYQFALFIIVYPILKALAQYRARRYRLARTSWRGIRGSMAGSAGEFAFLSWATSLLYPLTLGWIAPWRAIYVQRFLIGDTMLGDRRLRLAGSTSKLYLTFALFWVGTVILTIATVYGTGKVLGPLTQFRTPADWARVTRWQWTEVAMVLFAAMFVWSLISSFYRASLYNLTANATTMLPSQGSGLPPLRFKLATRGPQLIWLFVTNQLLTYGSLFVLRPIATARSMRYFTQQLSIIGPFDPATMRQNPHAALSEGEGLAQAFDFDAF